MAIKMQDKKSYLNVGGSGRFDFFGKTKMFVMLSIILVVASLAYIGAKGLNYGIDFAGGTEMQVQFTNNVEVDEVRNFLGEVGLEHAQLQKFGGSNEFLIRFQQPEGKTAQETNQILADKVKSITTGLQTKFASMVPEIRRVDTVGPQVGSQLKKNSLLAMFYSMLLILVYIGLRFDYIFAPGAVICLFHDVIVTLGIVAVLGKEINVQILAALLTIIGYSLNDTIVIFDRVRENADIHSDKQLPWVINKSMNEMLGRTIVTSALTLVSTLCLYIFADGAIRDFAFAMSIGIVAGSYSTIYIASPAVVLFDYIQKKKKTA